MSSSTSFAADASSLPESIARLFSIFGPSKHLGTLRSEAGSSNSNSTINDVNSSGSRHNGTGNSHGSSNSNGIGGAGGEEEEEEREGEEELAAEELASWRTYAEIGSETACFAAGLAAPPLGLARRSAVGVCLPNCPEWLIVDFACALDDLVVVGLHAKWTDAAFHSICNEAEVTCCIATSDMTGRLLEGIRAGELPQLRCIVEVKINNTAGLAVSETSPLSTSLPEGVQVVQYDQVLAAGATFRRTHTGYGFGAVSVDASVVPGDDQDIFTLLYSSGTTGGVPKATAVPKSVWRKSNCSAGPFAVMSPHERRAVSYLSMAHGADRGIAWSASFAGGSLGFAPPDDDPLFFKALKIFRPTFFLGMSYFWQDRYNDHLQTLLPALDVVLAKHLGSELATVVQQADPTLWGELRTALLATRRGQAIERRCLQDCAARLGRALLLAATGGAPTPESVRKFMAGCLEVGNESRVMDVYGSTEFPGISTNGAISPDVELKLLEVSAPDGRILYSPEDQPPQGEIAVRRRTDIGSTYYFKRPELTKEAWTEDGFYRTGDVGLLDYSDPQEGGQPRLCIIDRVKNLEEVYWEGDSAWIQATALEDGVYGILPEVQSLVLAADRNRDGVVAIVVVSKGFLRSWRSRQPADADLPGLEEMLERQASLPRGSREAADAVPVQLELAILRALRDAGQSVGLEPYEIPTACVVELGSWSSHRGPDGSPALLTITGKPLRGSVKLAYMEALGSRYGTTATLDASDVPATSDAVAPSSVQVTPAARATTRSLIDALQAEASDEKHSQAQHEFAKRFKSPLPSEKRGSRICDTSFVDEAGRPVHSAPTARSREWIAGPESFQFARVRDVDGAGNLLSLEQISSPEMSSEPLESPGTVGTSGSASLPSDGAPLQVAAIVEDAGGVARRQVALAVNKFQTLRRLRRSIARELEVPLRSVRLLLSSRGELEDDGQTLDSFGEDPLVLTVQTRPTPTEVHYDLEARSRTLLNAKLKAVKRLALELRTGASKWGLEAESKRAQAKAAIDFASEAARNEVSLATSHFAQTWGELIASATGSYLASMLPQSISRNRATKEPPLLAEVRNILRSIVRGKTSVLAQQEILSGLSVWPPDRHKVLEKLTRAIVALRIAGDDTDVDTRSLPVTWTMDLDWAVPPLRPQTTLCVLGCGQTVYQNEMLAHIEAGCDARVGLASEADIEANANAGVSMGGSQAIYCELSGVEIDPENTELKPTEEGGQLPYRPGVRFHNVDAGVDRLPELHQLAGFLHAAVEQALDANVEGSAEAKKMLEAVDPYKEDCWVMDKQHIYWLHRHVCAGKDLGLNDTPASLIRRACDAFENRLCLAVPDATLVSDAQLPRKTPRLALPAAAGLSVEDRNSFHFLRYQDLGSLIERTAAGFQSLAPPRSLVAICGYNDFEWCVADFAAAAAGFASVGVHTTYDALGAAEVLDLAKPGLLCCMQDILGPAGSRAPYWDVAMLLRDSAWCIASVRALVSMDSSIADAERLVEGLAPPHLRLTSMLAMVAPDSALQTSKLPDPFQARGIEYSVADGSKQDLTTLLFTSGSSGKPKAVAVGVDGFVRDIAGDATERKSFSSAVTVSYIPLSHSSDRYKVWQHCINGGRVGLCYYAAANWEAHEKEKKSAMLLYSSPIDGLFRQVQSLKPTNMACPPNIWAGLQQKYKDSLERGELESEALASVAALFGGKAKTLATGGSPTPADVEAFARRLARFLGATFTDSYGTTECGAIASDGRQLGPKFEDIEISLVDHPDLGFCRTSQPFPSGELAVKTPSLCLGYYGKPVSEDDNFILVDASNPCPDWIQPPLKEGRWYLTKDLAMLDPSGKLTLIDRVGAIVRTSGGILVRLGELEAMIENLPGVKFCLCHAAGTHASVVAIVVPTTRPNADSERHINGNDHQARPAQSGPDAQLQAPLASNADIRSFGAQEVPDFWVTLSEKLGPAPISFGVAQDDWTVANGLLSGELKKRRGELLRAYRDALEALLNRRED